MVLVTRERKTIIQKFLSRKVVIEEDVEIGANSLIELLWE